MIIVTLIAVALTLGFLYGFVQCVRDAFRRARDRESRWGSFESGVAMSRGSCIVWAFTMLWLAAVSGSYAFRVDLPMLTSFWPAIPVFVAHTICSLYDTTRARKRRDADES